MHWLLTLIHPSSILCLFLDNYGTLSESWHRWFCCRIYILPQMPRGGGGPGRLPHSRESTVDLSPVWERLTHPQHQYSKQFVWFVMASGLTFHRSRDILITRCFKFRRVGCRWFSITCWLCCCWPGKPQQLGRRHSERAAGTGHNERAASTAVYPRWHRVRHRSD